MLTSLFRQARRSVTARRDRTRFERFYADADPRVQHELRIAARR